jgi:hypothetical protein
VDDNPVQALRERLQPLIQSCGGALVLERVARGGGATRWFFCPTVAVIDEVVGRLRPGSRVGFFFGAGLRREPFSDEIEAAMWDLVAKTGEVVFGRSQPHDPELEVCLLDSVYFSEAVSGVPAGEVVFFGVFPVIAHDGVTCVAFTPPEVDGVARPQPV